MGLVSFEEKKRRQRSLSPPMGKCLSIDQEVSSPGSESTDTLILAFPTPRTLRNVHLLCEQPSIWCFGVVSQAD